jgi:FKBP-type peptidyl-prolyl cis-trans isomerase FkpA
VAALHYKLHVGSESSPVIEESRTGGQPFIITTSGVYPGFSEALKIMQQGGSYVLTLPPGTHVKVPTPGAPFGPNDTIIFEVDVLTIERGAGPRMQQMQ